MTIPQLIESDPEYMIIAPCGLNLERTKEEIGKYMLNEEWFRKMRCVKEGGVVIVDGNEYFNRSGPRLIDAYEFVCGWLYGEMGMVRKDFKWEKLDVEKLRVEWEKENRKKKEIRYEHHDSMSSFLIILHSNFNPFY